MTISKGDPWGSAVERPPALIVAATDAELAKLVAADPGGCYGVSAGDVHRSVGAPPPRDAMQRLPMDAMLVGLDGTEPIVAVANVVVCGRWWRGRVLAVTNVGLSGNWNVAPRAHPNDGRFDIVDVAASMPFRARIEARRRLPHGTHVPHPEITVAARITYETSFSTPTPVTVDGVDHGRCRTLIVTIAPDHFAIHV